MIPLREIKRKIRSVRNIEQICRAMKTVASIRLRRAQERLERTRPYRTRIASLAARMAAVSQDHPFLQPREARRQGVVLITSDRGLCGGYNANAVRRALALGTPDQLAAIAVGRKGRGHLARRGYQIVDSLVPLGGEPDAAAVAQLADRLGARYQEGELDQVILVYARFLGGTRADLVADVVVPVRTGQPTLENAIFEPAPPYLLPGLMRRYLQAQLLGAVLEASASEHAARVAAMTAATDNAEEMIADLILDYNQARQAAITKELTEIVGAAEAAA